MSASTRQFASFDQFYEYYLTEHSNRTCRRLHFVGTTLAVLLLVYAVVTLSPWFILLGFVVAYGFAWVGHFFFEKNKPATFTYPWQSFKGDWRMWWDTLRGRIPF